jgi:hypothetical protein
VWNATVFGPVDSPWEGGIFSLKVCANLSQCAAAVGFNVILAGVVLTRPVLRCMLRADDIHGQVSRQAPSCALHLRDV